MMLASPLIFQYPHLHNPSREIVTPLWFPLINVGFSALIPTSLSIVSNKFLLQTYTHPI
jgi:hypothetical protein